MELSALQSLQSVGTELYKKGDVDKELKTRDMLRRKVDATKPPPIVASTKLTIARFFKRFAKGFGAGYGINCVLALVKLLLKVSRGSVKGSLLVSAIKKLLTDKDSIAYGLFLGSFFAIFESVMRLTRYIRLIRGLPAEKLLSRVRYRSILAGSMAGLSLLLAPKTSRAPIAVFFFVRAIEVLCTFLLESDRIPDSVESFGHYDVLLMCVASIQVLYSALHHPEDVPPSYMSFLSAHSGLSKESRKAFATLHTAGGVPAGDLCALNMSRAKDGFDPIAVAATAPSQIPVRTLGCLIAHPATNSCIQHFFSFWSKGFKRSIRVYLPIYIIPLIVFRFKKLMSAPIPTMTRTIQGILRSTMFLSVYCASAWSSMCLLRKTTGSANTLICGPVGGLALLLEVKHRRIELALYVFFQALQTGYNQLSRTRMLPVIKHFEILLFSLSSAVIMHAYINCPVVMRKGYFTALRFFFGRGGVEEGFPRLHSSSSVDLRSLGSQDDGDEGIGHEPNLPPFEDGFEDP